MNENPFKQKTLEGRLYKDGKDIGDKQFHEKFMDMSQETEEERLKDMVAFVKK